MKLQSCLTLILLLNVCAAFSQATEDDDGADGRFFAKIFGSYSITTPGSFKAPSSQATVRSESSTTSTFKDKRKGMGAGLRVGAGVGFIVNEYINVGVDGEYLLGSKLESTSSTQIYGNVVYNFTQNLPDTTLASGNYKLEHSIVSIIPHITFKAISTSQYYIYTRVGVIIGIPLEIKITENNQTTHTTRIPNPVIAGEAFNYFNDTKVASIHEYKSNPGVGYQAALGVQFRISDNLRFYAEAVSNSLVLRPVEYEETENNTEKISLSSTDGQPAPTAPIITDHSRTIQQFSNNSSTGTRTSGPPGNQVTFFQSSKISIPINSLNFGIGLAYRF